MLIRSVSGVRGLVGVDLTPSVVRRYGRAFGRLAWGEILVGWDSRHGGSELRDAVAIGLSESGRGVIDAGIVPTPTIGVGVRLHGFGGGVAVTASHNPEEYNGLKFFDASGVFLDGEQAARLFESADQEVPDLRSAGAGETGRRSTSGNGATPGSSSAPPWGAAPGDLVGRHIDLILSLPFVDREAVRRAQPKVVVDCVNATGSVILPRLLRLLGCRVVEISTDTTAGFPRGAEPIPANLEQLCRAVVASGADAGFACDPDADRLAIVDETGTAIGEEYTLAIASRVVLTHQRGPVVANVSTSRMIDDLAGEFGVPIYRTPIGEINVVAKMREVAAVVGGEGNGGVVVPGVHPGRDAATAAALIVSGMAAGRSGAVAELRRGFVDYVSVKTKLEPGAVTRDDIVASMTAAFPDGERDLVDGAKIIWPDRWIHARMSGTEPVVRVIAEASRAEDAAYLIERAVSALRGGAGGADECVE
ncbi:MAG: phosphoglucosamine mutase [Candidatus Eisenbacteria bacterium]|nr:phosphoglucosamine mutase [Candidatus Eisenbacteria bacterium]